MDFTTHNFHTMRVSKQIEFCVLKIFQPSFIIWSEGYAEFGLNVFIWTSIFSFSASVCDKFYPKKSFGMTCIRINIETLEIQIKGSFPVNLCW